jgi:hypothetical protein
LIQFLPSQENLPKRPDIQDRLPLQPLLDLWDRQDQLPQFQPVLAIQ